MKLRCLLKNKTLSFKVRTFDKKKKAKKYSVYSKILTVKVKNSLVKVTEIFYNIEVTLGKPADLLVINQGKYGGNGKMEIVCLDLEGVLVPEIWIAFSEATGIPELKKTTRDEPDYDKLMNFRLGILKEHGLGLKEIQETIATIDPIPGAKEFLDELRSMTQVIIISDTFSQFAGPLMKKLGYPTIFCNELVVAEDGEITGFKMR